MSDTMRDSYATASALDVGGGGGTAGGGGAGGAAGGVGAGGAAGGAV
ncbi:MAG: hypothetical protein M3Y26_11325 [Actinomycetota bacterium]|nr:hypothetical protein [Actinomycetota bacterium]